MTEEQRERRRQMQHARYVRKREEILAYQKQYRASHKEAIKARRRQRSFERIYMNPNRKPPKTRQEFNRSYYLRHRDEILIKRKIEYVRKREEILAYQKQYRASHKEAIKARDSSGVSKEFT